MYVYMPKGDAEQAAQNYRNEHPPSNRVVQFRQMHNQANRVNQVHNEIKMIDHDNN